MLNKIYSLFFSNDMDIAERLFRVLLLVGTTAVFCAILQGLTLVNAGDLMLLYIVMLLIFILAFVVTFKYRNIKDYIYFNGRNKSLFSS